MNTPAEPRPSEATVHAYETLRERSLERFPRSGGELGLNLLLRQGMLAWTRVYAAKLSGARSRSAPPDPTRIPAPVRDNIIDVMVAMATQVSRSLRQGVIQQ
jgi:hypothetical protein